MYTVLDLFSGSGGMSCGFARNNAFTVVGAVDKQNAKPSMGEGASECNKTFFHNIGIAPMEADLSSVSPKEIESYLKEQDKTQLLDVLISCAPCTGFSKTVRKNLVSDDVRNSLVSRSALYVGFFKPKVFLMENVGELLLGKSSYHYEHLKQSLMEIGYSVTASVHNLSDFGLPQSRKRSLVIAIRTDVGPFRTLEELWEGYAVSDQAKTVRHAIEKLAPLMAGEADQNDPNHRCPNTSELGSRRFEVTPHDGGDWTAWTKESDASTLLIPSMKRYADVGKVGPYRDVYGRLWWDRPSVTLKRECSSTGNGRYAHPVQNRLCSVREMALLQGFPRDYLFVAKSLSNMYRHIGDSVPPLISYQLSKLCEWMITGVKPEIYECILPNSTLEHGHINKVPTQLALTS